MIVIVLALVVVPAASALSFVLVMWLLPHHFAAIVALCHARTVSMIMI